MKVIAKIDSNKVLCEVSVEELAFLNGFRSSWEKEFNKDRATAVGAECNIGKMVSTSRFDRTLRPDALKTTRDNLEQIVKQIDSTMETVSSLEIFNILNEEQQIGE